MVLLVLILIALSLLLEGLALRRAPESIAASYAADRKTLEPGEEFRILVTVENRTRLPVPFLRLKLHLPGDIHTRVDPSVIQPGIHGDQYLNRTVWLRPKQRLVWSIDASIDSRGRYFLWDLGVFGGDFLGLKETEKTVNQFNELVVYPRAAADRNVDDVLGGFMGDVSVSRFLFEDPVLTLGFREYTGREPFKTISWTQSARAGSLMVKKYDYTAEPFVSVMLNIDGCKDNSLIEAAYSLTRTVLEKLEEQGVRYDFSTNAAAAGAISGWTQTGDGLGSRHFFGILEGLGRATYTPVMSFEALADSAVTAGFGTRGRILISPELPDDPAALTRLRTAADGDLLILTAKEGA